MQERGNRHLDHPLNITDGIAGCPLQWRHAQRRVPFLLARVRCQMVGGSMLQCRRQHCFGATAKRCIRQARRIADEAPSAGKSIFRDGRINAAATLAFLQATDVQPHIGPGLIHHESAARPGLEDCRTLGPGFVQHALERGAGQVTVRVQAAHQPHIRGDATHGRHKVAALVLRIAEQGIDRGQLGGELSRKGIIAVSPRIEASVSGQASGSIFSVHAPANLSALDGAEHAFGRAEAAAGERAVQRPDKLAHPLEGACGKAALRPATAVPVGEHVGDCFLDKLGFGQPVFAITLADFRHPRRVGQGRLAQRRPFCRLEQAKVFERVDHLVVQRPCGVRCLHGHLNEAPVIAAIDARQLLAAQRRLDTVADAQGNLFVEAQRLQALGQSRLQAGDGVGRSLLCSGLLCSDGQPIRIDAQQQVA